MAFVAANVRRSRLPRGGEVHALPTPEVPGAERRGLGCQPGRDRRAGVARHVAGDGGYAEQHAASRLTAASHQPLWSRCGSTPRRGEER